MRYGYNIVLVICICSLVPAYADLLQRVMTPYAKYPYADICMNMQTSVSLLGRKSFVTFGAPYESPPLRTVSILSVRALLAGAYRAYLWSIRLVL